MQTEKFGVAKDGQEVFLYTFENDKRMKMTVSNMGAVLTNLWVPDKDGVLRDVVLGYDTVLAYENNVDTHFGATIGRSANRIENAEFKLQGKKYKLAKNDSENNLHSGPNGYQLRVWKVKKIEEENRSITFSLVSSDGDQGYPGELHLDVTYQLQEDAVVITYDAASNEDTIFNPTNHSYFNLNGHESGDILDHNLQLEADSFTPIKDSHSIPTGEVSSVENTPMDFRLEKKIGKDIEEKYDQLVYAQGYDHNFVLNEGIEKFAQLTGDQSGIVMEAGTNLPGVQIYTGNFLDNVLGKGGVAYLFRAGVCLETQYFPNAVNEKNFVTPLLEKNKKTEYRTYYSFSSV
ncbi:MAG: galactose mutarotase [Tetragenococcus sp.]|nr:galactose mutarotase [Tetragenococcus sp.]